MSRDWRKPEVSLYAKLIFGERASSKPVCGAASLQAGGNGTARLPHVFPASASPVDGHAAAPATGNETAQ
jgi:hypothetical protein